MRQSRDFTTSFTPTMVRPGRLACRYHSCSLTVERRVTERLEAQSSKSRQTHALLDMKNPPQSAPHRRRARAPVGMVGEKLAPDPVVGGEVDYIAAGIVFE